jgi:Ice-binding-like/PEP-CTERM motif
MCIWTALALCHPSVAFAGSILGTADLFAILGASTVTNTGSTIISGDLGVYAGSSITGFPPGSVVNGTSNDMNSVAQQAQLDENTAYNTLASLPVTDDLTGEDLGGLTLTPGVYFFSSSVGLTGTLTLNFENDPNAMFVFQIGSTLTTASGASVVVENGTSSDGIFWQVGSSATLGTGTSFAGNILALTSVTLTTGTSIGCGRAFAHVGAVTLDDNFVSNNCSLDNVNSSTGGNSPTGPTDFGSSGFDGSPSATPEPGTFLLLGIGLAAIVVKHAGRKESTVPVAHAMISSNPQPRVV